MSEATPPTYIAGETIHFLSSLTSVHDNIDPDDAVVTFTIDDLNGIEVVAATTGTLIAANDQFFVDVNAPTTAGFYVCKVEATIGAIVSREKYTFSVEAF